ncbi:MAG: hypothetical protein ACK5H9_05215, partial [Bacteroidota bacterium]
SYSQYNLVRISLRSLTYHFLEIKVFATSSQFSTPYYIIFSGKWGYPTSLSPYAFGNSSTPRLYALPKGSNK